jgi:CRP-like cAMP-binding protein
MVIKNLVKAISNYVTLVDDDIILIEKLFEIKELRKDECFLEPGKVCNKFAFVNKGLFRHSIFNNGEEKTIYFSSDNDFICDYESFINKIDSKKAITAMENTTIAFISYKNMQIFYNKVSSGERFGRLLLEEIYVKVINHIISSHIDSAEQKYLNFLSSYSHLQQRIPQYYIASFVGVAPQSLSRIRRKLVKI